MSLPEQVDANVVLAKDKLDLNSMILVGFLLCQLSLRNHDDDDGAASAAAAAVVANAKKTTTRKQRENSARFHINAVQTRLLTTAPGHASRDKMMPNKWPGYLIFRAKLFLISCTPRGL